MEARAKALAEDEEWRGRRAELEAEHEVENKAAVKQLEEQRRAYTFKLKEAREVEYAQ